MEACLCVGFFHMMMKESGPTTLSLSHIQYKQYIHTHTHTYGTGRHAIESCSVHQQCVFVFQTQSVNVRGPSSLSLGLARCQTAFLQQLPFLTSAALTWFHLTVVRNLAFL